MKNKKKLQEGDIYYVQVNNKYVFGRILLDVSERILKLEPQHKYKFYSGCYLAEVYKGIYDEPLLTTNEIILPCQFVLKKYFYFQNYNVEWVYYKHYPIKYKELDFPEFLETGKNGLINFSKFDISLPTKTLFEDFPRMPTESSNQRYTGYINTTFSQMVDLAFHMQGRDDLLQTKGTYFLIPNELRLSLGDRKQFYQEIGEDLNTPYYELSLKYGFDLERFY